MAEPFEDLWVNAADGLRLHVASAGPTDGKRLPVVCLPGIARTGEDFTELMQAFASGPSPRRAIAIDSRGRGQSQWDKNAANYNPILELGDVIAVLNALGIARAVFVGTSRGGILSMLMPAARPQAIAGVVLNDIGPVIDIAGLLRIKGYVGKLSKPRSWAEAVAVLKSTVSGQFPALDEREWDLWARRTWTEKDGAFEPRYDPALSAALAAVDPAVPPPALWPQFEMLKPYPLLVLRGEHSDILSRVKLAEMQSRHPDMQSIEITGQGHAPLLLRDDSISPIVQFVKRCERG